MNADESRTGFFSGIGVGVGSFNIFGNSAIASSVPLEVGYGINEDLLVHFSIEALGPIGVKTLSVGLGGLIFIETMCILERHKV